MKVDVSDELRSLEIMLIEMRKAGAQKEVVSPAYVEQALTLLEVIKSKLR